MTQKQCRTRNQHASGLLTAQDLGWSQGENISREARLEIALKNLVWCCENNTGNEPSLSCYYRALDEAKNLIE